MPEDQFQSTIKPQEEMEIEKSRRLFKKYVSFFIMLLLLSGSFFLGFNQGKKSEISEAEISVPLDQAIIENRFPDPGKNIDFSLFWRVWDLLKEKHIDKDKLNAQELVYGAISGMLRSTGDPYSSFFDPKESQSFTEGLEGSFEGIGAELGIKDETLTIIAPLKGSPSQKAGLMAGDKILKINGKVSADFTIDEAVKVIRGKKGTGVVLTILHNGGQETEDITVIRDTIEIKSVELEMKENNIAHLRINRFGENTTKEFNAAVSSMIENGTKGIILDLRSNPGGLLDKAVDIADRMIPKGKIIVTEEDSAGKRENIYTSGGDRLSNISTVVLIDGGSASASEILAGALKDNQGVMLIGKKSFGKGSVQELIELNGGSSVKITIAKWLTPKGEYIMEKGIIPDVEVDYTREDLENKEDPQLDKAIEIIKGKMIL